MDFLDFLVGVNRRIGVVIAEADDPRLETLGALVAHVAELQVRP